MGAAVYGIQKQRSVLGAPFGAERTKGDEENDGGDLQPAIVGPILQMKQRMMPIHVAMATISTAISSAA